MVKHLFQNRFSLELVQDNSIRNKSLPETVALLVESYMNNALALFMTLNCRHIVHSDVNMKSYVSYRIKF